MQQSRIHNQPSDEALKKEIQGYYVPMIQLAEELHQNHHRSMDNYLVL